MFNQHKLGVSPCSKALNLLMIATLEANPVSKQPAPVVQTECGGIGSGVSTVHRWPKESCSFRYFKLDSFCYEEISLPETTKLPLKMEDEGFPFGARPIFRGNSVRFREGNFALRQETIPTIAARAGMHFFPHVGEIFKVSKDSKIP